VQRLVVQKVTHAKVEVAGELVGSIERGLCVLVGLNTEDTIDVVKQQCASESLGHPLRR
jgi:D-Tyr-tRNAtyr deacylase